MIGAYDEWGNVVDLVEWEEKIRADAFDRGYDKGRADAINARKNDLHDRLKEELNKPYQDQSLCQGLYYAIQRCDWYLTDDKEQKNEQNG